jgi:hypothetical protein
MQKTKFFFLCVILAPALCLAQLTPQGAVSRVGGYVGLDDKSLKAIQAYSSALIVGLGAVTPAQALTAATAYQGLDDKSLSAIIAYGMANAVIPPTTNSTVYNVATPQIYTNVMFQGQMVFFSNSVTSGQQPALQTMGGVYSDLYITNSPSISASIEQVCIGTPTTTKFDTLTRDIIIRNSVFWSDGISGDAAYFGEVLSGSGVATNRVFFQNVIFHSANLGLVPFGFWKMYLQGCFFDVYGYGLCPDQGPNTNICSDTIFDVKAGASLGIDAVSKVSSAILAEVRGRAILNNCDFRIITTNAAHSATALMFSAEPSLSTVVILNNCHVHLEGPGTNTVIDMRLNPGNETGCSIILNNVYFDGVNGESGASTVVVQNNSGSGQFQTITVLGGNLTPANFATLTSVTFLNQPTTPFAGNTGGQAIPAATTVFYAPFGNSATNFATSDVSSFTRNTVNRTMVLGNLYVTRDAAGGVGHTTTVTVMTNGVASNIIASLNNSLTGNDTTHFVTVLAGTELGVKIITPASDTPGKHSWIFGGQ